MGKVSVDGGGLLAMPEVAEPDRAVASADGSVFFKSGNLPDSLSGDALARQALAALVQNRDNAKVIKDAFAGFDFPGSDKFQILFDYFAPHCFQRNDAGQIVAGSLPSTADIAAHAADLKAFLVAQTPAAKAQAAQSRDAVDHTGSVKLDEPVTETVRIAAGEKREPTKTSLALQPAFDAFSGIAADDLASVKDKDPAFERSARSIADTLSLAVTPDSRAAIYRRAITLSEKNSWPPALLERVLTSAVSRGVTDKTPAETSPLTVFKEEFAAVKADMAEAARTGKTQPELRIAAALAKLTSQMNAAELEKKGITTDDLDEMRRTGVVPAGYSAMMTEYLAGKDQNLNGTLSALQAYSKAVADFRKATGDCSAEEARAVKHAADVDAAKCGQKWMADINGNASAAAHHVGVCKKAIADDTAALAQLHAKGAPAAAIATAQKKLDHATQALTTAEKHYKTAADAVRVAYSNQIKWAGGEDKAPSKLKKTAAVAEARAGAATGMVAGTTMGEATATPVIDQGKVNQAVALADEAQADVDRSKAYDPQWSSNPQLLELHETALEGARGVYQDALSRASKPPADLKDKAGAATSTLDKTYSTDLVLSQKLLNGPTSPYKSDGEYAQHIAEIAPKAIAVRLDIARAVSDVQQANQQQALAAGTAVLNKGQAAERQDKCKVLDAQILDLEQQIDASKRTGIWNRATKFVGTDLNHFADSRTEIQVQIDRLKSLREATIQGVDGPERDIQTYGAKLAAAQYNGDTKAIRDCQKRLESARAQKAHGLQQYDESQKPRPVADISTSPSFALVQAYVGQPLAGHPELIDKAYRQATGGDYARDDRGLPQAPRNDANTLTLAGMQSQLKEAVFMGADALSPDDFDKLKDQWVASDVTYLAGRKELARGEARLDMLKYDTAHVADKFTPTATSTDYDFAAEDQQKWNADRVAARTTAAAAAYSTHAGDIDYQLGTDLDLRSVSSMHPDVEAPPNAAVGMAYARAAAALSDSSTEQTATCLRAANAAVVPSEQAASYDAQIGALAMTAWTSTIDPAATAMIDQHYQGLHAARVGQVFDSAHAIIERDGVAPEVKAGFDVFLHLHDDLEGVRQRHRQEILDGASGALARADLGVTERYEADIDNGGAFAGQIGARALRVGNQDEELAANAIGVDSATQQFLADSDRVFDRFASLSEGEKFAVLAAGAMSEDNARTAFATSGIDPVGVAMPPGAASDLAHQVLNGSHVTQAVVSNLSKSFKDAAKEADDAKNASYGGVSTYVALAAPGAEAIATRRESELAKENRYWANNRYGPMLLDEAMFFALTAGASEVFSAAKLGANMVRGVATAEEVAQGSRWAARLASDARFVRTVNGAGRLVTWARDARGFSTAIRVGEKVSDVSEHFSALVRKGEKWADSGGWLAGQTYRVARSYLHMQVINTVVDGADAAAARLFGKDSWVTASVGASSKFYFFFSGAVPGIGPIGMVKWDAIQNAVSQGFINVVWNPDTDPVGNKQAAAVWGFASQVSMSIEGVHESGKGAHERAKAEAEALHETFKRELPAGTELPKTFEVDYAAVAGKYYDRLRDGTMTAAERRDFRDDVYKTFGADQSPDLKSAADAYFRVQIAPEAIHDAHLDAVDWSKSLPAVELEARLSQAEQHVLESGVTSNRAEAAKIVFDQVQAAMQAQARDITTPEAQRALNDYSERLNAHSQLTASAAMVAARVPEAQRDATQAAVFAAMQNGGKDFRDKLASELTAAYRAAGLEKPEEAAASVARDAALRLADYRASSKAVTADLTPANARVAHEQALLDLGFPAHEVKQQALDAYARSMGRHFADAYAQRYPKIAEPVLARAMGGEIATLQGERLSLESMAKSQQSICKSLEALGFSKADALDAANVYLSDVVTTYALERSGTTKPEENPGLFLREYRSALQTLALPDAAHLLRSTVSEILEHRAGEALASAKDLPAQTRALLQAANEQDSEDPAGAKLTAEVVGDFVFDRALKAAQAEVLTRPGATKMTPAERSEAVFIELTELVRGSGVVNPDALVEVKSGKAPNPNPSVRPPSLDLGGLPSKSVTRIEQLLQFANSGLGTETFLGFVAKERARANTLSPELAHRSMVAVGLAEKFYFDLRASRRMEPIRQHVDAVIGELPAGFVKSDVVASITAVLVDHDRRHPLNEFKSDGIILDLRDDVPDLRSKIAHTLEAKGLPHELAKAIARDVAVDQMVAAYMNHSSGRFFDARMGTMAPVVSELLDKFSDMSFVSSFLRTLMTEVEVEEAKIDPSVGNGARQRSALLRVIVRRAKEVGLLDSSVTPSALTNVVSEETFAAMLGKGTLFFDAAFEELAHGIDTHNIQLLAAAPFLNEILGQRAAPPRDVREFMKWMSEDPAGRWFPVFDRASTPFDMRNPEHLGAIVSSVLYGTRFQVEQAEGRRERALALVGRRIFEESPRHSPQADALVAHSEILEKIQADVKRPLIERSAAREERAFLGAIARTPDVTTARRALMLSRSVVQKPGETAEDFATRKVCVLQLAVELLPLYRTTDPKRLETGRADIENLARAITDPEFDQTLAELRSHDDGSPGRPRVLARLLGLPGSNEFERVSAASVRDASPEVPFVDGSQQRIDALTTTLQAKGLNEDEIAQVIAANFPDREDAKLRGENLPAIGRSHDIAPTVQSLLESVGKPGGPKSAFIIKSEPWNQSGMNSSNGTDAADAKLIEMYSAHFAHIKKAVEDAGGYIKVYRDGNSTNLLTVAIFPDHEASEVSGKVEAGVNAGINEANQWAIANGLASTPNSKLNGPAFTKLSKHEKEALEAEFGGVHIDAVVVTLDPDKNAGQNLEAAAKAMQAAIPKIPVRFAAAPELPRSNIKSDGSEVIELTTAADYVPSSFGGDAYSDYAERRRAAIAASARVMGPAEAGALFDAQQAKFQDSVLRIRPTEEIQRSFATAVRKAPEGSQIVNAEFDIGNLGRLTDLFGRDLANVIFRKVYGITAKRIIALAKENGAEAHFFRKGGDELSVMIVFPPDVKLSPEAAAKKCKQITQLAMGEAQAEIRDWMQRGVVQTPDGKLTALRNIMHRKHADLEFKDGVGISYGVSIVDRSQPIEKALKTANADVDVQKMRPNPVIANEDMADGLGVPPYKLARVGQALAALDRSIAAEPPATSKEERTARNEKLRQAREEILLGGGADPKKVEQHYSRKVTRVALDRTTENEADTRLAALKDPKKILDLAEMFSQARDTSRAHVTFLKRMFAADATPEQIEKAWLAVANLSAAELTAKLTPAFGQLDDDACAIACLQYLKVNLDLELAVILATDPVEAKRLQAEAIDKRNARGIGVDVTMDAEAQRQFLHSYGVTYRKLTRNGDINPDTIQKTLVSGKPVMLYVSVPGGAPEDSHAVVIRRAQADGFFVYDPALPQDEASKRAQFISTADLKAGKYPCAAGESRIKAVLMPDLPDLLRGVSLTITDPHEQALFNAAKTQAYADTSAKGGKEGQAAQSIREGRAYWLVSRARDAQTVLQDPKSTAADRALATSERGLTEQIAHSGDPSAAQYASEMLARMSSIERPMTPAQQTAWIELLRSQMPADQVDAGTEISAGRERVKLVYDAFFKGFDTNTLQGIEPDSPPGLLLALIGSGEPFAGSDLREAALALTHKDKHPVEYAALMNATTDAEKVAAFRALTVIGQVIAKNRGDRYMPVRGDDPYADAPGFTKHEWVEHPEDGGSVQFLGLKKNEAGEVYVDPATGQPIAMIGSDEFPEEFPLSQIVKEQTISSEPPVLAFRPTERMPAAPSSRIPIDPGPTESAFRAIGGGELKASSFNDPSPQTVQVPGQTSRQVWYLDSTHPEINSATVYRLDAQNHVVTHEVPLDQLTAMNTVVSSGQVFFTDANGEHQGTVDGFEVHRFVVDGKVTEIENVRIRLPDGDLRTRARADVYTRHELYKPGDFVFYEGQMVVVEKQPNNDPRKVRLNGQDVLVSSAIAHDPFFRGRQVEVIDTVRGKTKPGEICAMSRDKVFVDVTPDKPFGQKIIEQYPRDAFSFAGGKTQVQSARGLDLRADPPFAADLDNTKFSAWSQAFEKNKDSPQGRFLGLLAQMADSHTQLASRALNIFANGNGDERLITKLRSAMIANDTAAIDLLGPVYTSYAKIAADEKAAANRPDELRALKYVRERVDLGLAEVLREPQSADSRRATLQLRRAEDKLQFLEALGTKQLDKRERQDPPADPNARMGARGMKPVSADDGGDAATLAVLSQIDAARSDLLRQRQTASVGDVETIDDLVRRTDAGMSEILREPPTAQSRELLQRVQAAPVNRRLEMVQGFASREGAQDAAAMGARGMKPRVGGAEGIAPDPTLAQRYPVKQKGLGVLDKLAALTKGFKVVDPRLLLPTDALDTSSPQALDALRASFATKGWSFAEAKDGSQAISVVVVDGKYFVTNGHLRLQAALEAGLDRVPIEIVEDSRSTAQLVHAARAAQGAGGEEPSPTTDPLPLQPAPPPMPPEILAIRDNIVWQRRLDDAGVPKDKQVEVRTAWQQAIDQSAAADAFAAQPIAKLQHDFIGTPSSIAAARKDLAGIRKLLHKPSAFAAERDSTIGQIDEVLGLLKSSPLESGKVGRRITALLMRAERATDSALQDEITTIVARAGGRYIVPNAIQTAVADGPRPLQPSRGAVASLSPDGKPAPSITVEGKTFVVGDTYVAAGTPNIPGNNWQIVAFEKVDGKDMAYLERSQPEQTPAGQNPEPSITIAVDKLRPDPINTAVARVLDAVTTQKAWQEVGLAISGVLARTQAAGMTPDQSVALAQFCLRVASGETLDGKEVIKQLRPEEFQQLRKLKVELRLPPRPAADQDAIATPREVARPAAPPAFPATELMPVHQIFDANAPAINWTDADAKYVKGIGLGDAALEDKVVRTLRAYGIRPDTLEDHPDRDANRVVYARALREAGVSDEKIAQELAKYPPEQPPPPDRGPGAPREPEEGQFMAAAQRPGAQPAVRRPIAPRAPPKGSLKEFDAVTLPDGRKAEIVSIKRDEATGIEWAHVLPAEQATNLAVASEAFPVDQLHPTTLDAKGKPPQLHSVTVAPPETAPVHVAATELDLGRQAPTIAMPNGLIIKPSDLVIVPGTKARAERETTPDVPWVLETTFPAQNIAVVRGANPPHQAMHVALDQLKAMNTACVGAQVRVNVLSGSFHRDAHQAFIAVDASGTKIETRDGWIDGEVVKIHNTPFGEVVTIRAQINGKAEEIERGRAEVFPVTRAYEEGDVVFYEGHAYAVAKTPLDKANPYHVTLSSVIVGSKTDPFEVPISSLAAQNPMYRQMPVELRDSTGGTVRHGAVSAINAKQTTVVFPATENSPAETLSFTNDLFTFANGATQVQVSTAFNRDAIPQFGHAKDTALFRELATAPTSAQANFLALVQEVAGKYGDLPIASQMLNAFAAANSNVLLMRKLRTAYVAGDLATIKLVSEICATYGAMARVHQSGDAKDTAAFAEMREQIDARLAAFLVEPPTENSRKLLAAYRAASPGERLDMLGAAQAPKSLPPREEKLAPVAITSQPTLVTPGKEIPNIENMLGALATKESKKTVQSLRASIEGIAAQLPASERADFLNSTFGRLRRLVELTATTPPLLSADELAETYEIAARLKLSSTEAVAKLYDLALCWPESADGALDLQSLEMSTLDILGAFRGVTAAGPEQSRAATALIYRLDNLARSGGTVIPSNQAVKTMVGAVARMPSGAADALTAVLQLGGNWGQGLRIMTRYAPFIAKDPTRVTNVLTVLTMIPGEPAVRKLVSQEIVRQLDALPQPPTAEQLQRIVTSSVEALRGWSSAQELAPLEQFSVSSAIARRDRLAVFANKPEISPLFAEVRLVNREAPALADAVLPGLENVMAPYLRSNDLDAFLSVYLAASPSDQQTLCGYLASIDSPVVRAVSMRMLSNEFFERAPGTLPPTAAQAVAGAKNRMRNVTIAQYKEERFAALKLLAAEPIELRREGHDLDELIESGATLIATTDSEGMVAAGRGLVAAHREQVESYIRANPEGLRQLRNTFAKEISQANPDLTPMELSTRVDAFERGMRQMLFANTVTLIPGINMLVPPGVDVSPFLPQLRFMANAAIRSGADFSRHSRVIVVAPNDADRLNEFSPINRNMSLGRADNVQTIGNATNRVTYSVFGSDTIPGRVLVHEFGHLIDGAGIMVKPGQTLHQWAQQHLQNMTAAQATSEHGSTQPNEYIAELLKEYMGYPPEAGRKPLKERDPVAFETLYEIFGNPPPLPREATTAIAAAKSKETRAAPEKAPSAARANVVMTSPVSARPIPADLVAKLNVLPADVRDAFVLAWSVPFSDRMMLRRVLDWPDRKAAESVYDAYANASRDQTARLSAYVGAHDSLLEISGADTVRSELLEVLQEKSPEPLAEIPNVESQLALMAKSDPDSARALGLAIERVMNSLPPADRADFLHFSLFHLQAIARDPTTRRMAELAQGYNLVASLQLPAVEFVGRVLDIAARWPANDGTSGTAQLLTELDGTHAAGPNQGRAVGALLIRMRELMNMSPTDPAYSALPTTESFVGLITSLASMSDKTAEAASSALNIGPNKHSVLPLLELYSAHFADGTPGVADALTALTMIPGTATAQAMVSTEIYTRLAALTKPPTRAQLDQIVNDSIANAKTLLEQDDSDSLSDYSAEKALARRDAAATFANDPAAARLAPEVKEIERSAPELGDVLLGGFETVHPHLLRTNDLDAFLSIYRVASEDDREGLRSFLGAITDPNERAAAMRMVSCEYFEREPGTARPSAAQAITGAQKRLLPITSAKTSLERATALGRLHAEPIELRREGHTFDKIVSAAMPIVAPTDPHVETMELAGRQIVVDNRAAIASYLRETPDGLRRLRNAFAKSIKEKNPNIPDLLLNARVDAIERGMQQMLFSTTTAIIPGVTIIVPEGVNVAPFLPQLRFLADGAKRSGADFDRHPRVIILAPNDVDRLAEFSHFKQPQNSGIADTAQKTGAVVNKVTYSVLAGDDTPGATLVHEFGHIIDAAGVMVAPNVTLHQWATTHLTELTPGQATSEYATKNTSEYLAELFKEYMGYARERGREPLEKRDPAAFAVMRRIWGDPPATPRERSQRIAGERPTIASGPSVLDSGKYAGTPKPATPLVQGLASAQTLSPAQVDKLEDAIVAARGATPDAREWRDAFNKAVQDYNKSRGDDRQGPSLRLLILSEANALGGTKSRQVTKQLSSLSVSELPALLAVVGTPDSAVGAYFLLRSSVIKDPRKAVLEKRLLDPDIAASLALRFAKETLTPEVIVSLKNEFSAMSEASFAAEKKAAKKNLGDAQREKTQYPATAPQSPITPTTATPNPAPAAVTETAPVRASPARAALMSPQTQADLLVDSGVKRAMGTGEFGRVKGAITEKLATDMLATQNPNRSIVTGVNFAEEIVGFKSQAEYEAKYGKQANVFVYERKMYRMVGEADAIVCKRGTMGGLVPEKLVEIKGRTLNYKVLDANGQPTVLTGKDARDQLRKTVEPILTGTYPNIRRVRAFLTAEDGKIGKPVTFAGAGAGKVAIVSVGTSESQGFDLTLPYTSDDLNQVTKALMPDRKSTPRTPVSAPPRTPITAASPSAADAAADSAVYRSIAGNDHLAARLLSDLDIYGPAAPSASNQDLFEALYIHLQSSCDAATRAKNAQMFSGIRDKWNAYAPLTAEQHAFLLAIMPDTATVRSIRSGPRTP